MPRNVTLSAVWNILDNEHITPLAKSRQLAKLFPAKKGEIEYWTRKWRDAQSETDQTFLSNIENSIKWS